MTIIIMFIFIRIYYIELLNYWSGIYFASDKLVDGKCFRSQKIVQSTNIIQMMVCFSLFLNY
jgi:hypothetical protein